MTTFSTNILSCPSCKQRMYTYELNSYTVMASECYSDGKIESEPIIPHNDGFLICSNCNKEFWTEDNLINTKDNIISEDLPMAKNPYDLDLMAETNFGFKMAQYYNNLLNKGFANSVERETQLRIKLWHILNNNYRNRSIGSNKYLLKPKIKGISRYLNVKLRDILSPEDRNIFKDNLVKLINIYRPKYDEESLMLAEMYRELGSFSEATDILKEIKSLENDKAYCQIRRAIKWKKTKVFKLNLN